MYLTEILLQNVGPIENLDVRLPFHENGLPKPLIFVGANGSGKTLLLAAIADSLILMATPHFQDVVPKTGIGYSYFKILGGSSRRVHTPFSLTLIKFKHNDISAHYFEKTGDLDQKSLESTIKARYPGLSWDKTKDKKHFSGFSAEIVENICESSAHCFFPSSRRENPHWLNIEAIGDASKKEPEIGDSERIANRLGKPIYVEKSRDANKQWILNVIFDSRTELFYENNEPTVAPYEKLGERLFFRVAKNNIDQVLQTVMGDNSLRIHATHRNHGTRLCVAREGTICIPSLDNLSLGQSLLFNLFCTIVRYADANDLQKGNNLNTIEGIVIIDEIDAHLHTDLQYTALPLLLKLFPKVQFIITTHAPMFLMGMEHEFGEDNISILEMPVGNSITTERFSEFQKSFDHYRQTKAYEDALRTSILSLSRPTILLEGETDRDYFVGYLELLGRQDLLEKLCIDWAGRNVNGAAHSGGTSSLDAITKTFQNKPELLKTKLMLIHDCDSPKKPLTIDGKLFVRTIPFCDSNRKFKRGIENSLSQSAAKPEFYDVKENEYGGEVNVLQKRRLCDWVLQQKDIEIYANFKPLLEFAEEIAAI